MAKFPKRVHGPVEVSPGQWEAIAVAVMPCRKTIKATGKGSERRAKSRAENLCDQSVRGHLASCQICPPETKKKYG